MSMNWCDKCQADESTDRLWVCRACGILLCERCMVLHRQQTGHRVQATPACFDRLSRSMAERLGLARPRGGV